MQSNNIRSYELLYYTICKHIIVYKDIGPMACFNMQWCTKYAVITDESKCAVKKGCLCSDKKVIRKFGWINKNVLVKRSFINWSPTFTIEMCSEWWIFLKTCSNRAYIMTISYTILWLPGIPNHSQLIQIVYISIHFNERKTGSSRVDSLAPLPITANRSVHKWIK